MARQYPSNKQLVQIGAAAERWAATVRNNWPVSDAANVENPARFITPESVDTATEKKQLARQIVDGMEATKTLRELVAIVEPDDPLAGLDTKLRWGFPIGKPEENAVCGWPVAVSSAVAILKKVGTSVYCQTKGPAWRRGMRPVPNETVQSVEWAAGVLREAAGPKGDNPQDVEVQSAEAPSAGRRKKPPRVTVEAKVAALLLKDPLTYRDWTHREFAIKIGCSPTAVYNTQTYKRLATAREMARLTRTEKAYNKNLSKKTDRSRKPMHNSSWDKGIRD
jgi:hypothetical protein